MLGKLFGNFDEKREEIKEALTQVEVEIEVAGGDVKIKGNAARQIQSIDIADELLQIENKGKLEDLLITAINDFTQVATEAEMEASKNVLKDMLPPGLGGLSKYFE